MGTFKLFWNLHKWTGLVASAMVLLTSVTGVLLLVKKRVDWIQPPTALGAAGEPGRFIPLQDAFEILLGLEHADFATTDDIDRVDVRPGRRVYKIRSKHHNAEVQVCAITGEVLSISTRPSDLIEQIHDGSFFAGWVHDWLMPAYAAALAFLAFSGWWLWLEPQYRRRRRRRREGSTAHRAGATLLPDDGGAGPR
jgi:uncharacterized iron-regulated membrane protein